jgi:hypothetical protein
MGEGGNERSHGRESYPGCNFSIMGDSAVEKDFEVFLCGVPASRDIVDLLVV